MAISIYLHLVSFPYEGGAKHSWFSHTGFSPSPLVGEGLGRGGLAASDQNALKHALKVAQYVVVPETQYGKTLTLQPGITLSIVGLRFGMLATVKFDDQFLFETNKVQDVVSKRLLPLEFDPLEAVCTQVPP